MGHFKIMYRVLGGKFVAGVAAMVLAVFAAGAPGARAEQVALQAPEGSEQLPHQAQFADILDTRLRVALTPETSGLDAAWLAQLRSFYSSRSGKPLWVAQPGWNERARAVMDEIARAGEWGLDASAFPLPALTSNSPSDADLAAAELALSQTVVKYAFHARGGRIEPSSLSLWLDRTEDPVFATQVMIDVATAEDAAAALRAMHPRSPAFQLLREAYAAMRHEMENPKALDPADVLNVPGDKLKVGDWHPDVQIIRRRLKFPGQPGFESRFDDKLANALNDYLDDRKISVKWGRIDDKVRAVFNRPPEPPTKDDLMRVLANMERWRWLPRDLGAFHIWNNLPEMETRVVKNGEVIHQERIIIGQPDTQTPVFSDEMRQIVFQPEWGVPPSIKVNDLLPRLQGGDYGVLERRGMRILGLSGKELRPTRFNWSKVDIRDIGIYQRSGDSNPLGRVKFLFPNKHHVYMHDTNNRSLFSASERLFSHGCVRVRAPETLAKVILGEDKGWGDAEVNALLKNTKQLNNKIDLDRPFPVHNVYFTLIPGEGRTLIKLDDVYGHDRRVIQALSGVPAAKIAASDPARNQQREIEEAAPPMVRKANRARVARDED